MLGIQEPAEHQCKNVDNMVTRVQEALAFTTQAVVAMDPQTIVQANKEARARLEGFEAQLEDLRAAIEQTRMWGVDWKRTAKELILRHEPGLLSRAAVENDDIPF